MVQYFGGDPWRQRREVRRWLEDSSRTGRRVEGGEEAYEAVRGGVPCGPAGEGRQRCGQGRGPTQVGRQRELRRPEEGLDLANPRRRRRRTERRGLKEGEEEWRRR